MDFTRRCRRDHQLPLHLSEVERSVFRALPVEEENARRPRMSRSLKCSRNFVSHFSSILSRADRHLVPFSFPLTRKIMLRSLSRLPLRRCIQTSARQAHRSPRQNQVVLVLGGTAVVGGYFTWRMASGAHDVALDAPSETASVFHWFCIFTRKLTASARQQRSIHSQHRPPARV
jgi:hypothetical protein